MDDALCVCGSGRPLRRCHGLRGSERRRRRRELHALSELHDLALLFPFVRPRGRLIDVFADRVAEGMGEEPRDTSAAEAAEGVRLLPQRERRRLVRSWADRYPARWRKICAEVEDRGLAEQTLVASAVRAAVADRIICPRGVVGELEGGALENSPGAAVALALAPQAVWSYEDVVAPSEAIAGPAEITRVRAQAARLRRRLPFEGLPRASATLARGYELVAQDDEAAAAVAALLLEAYAVMLEARSRSIGQRN